MPKPNINANGLAVDGLGNVYIASGLNTIMEISPAGVVTNIAGTGKKGSGDGNGESAQFAGPRALALDFRGNLFVADTENQTIRKITPQGIVSTLAGRFRLARGEGGLVTLFSGPFSDEMEVDFDGGCGIAMDRLGYFYVVDPRSNTVNRISPTGKILAFAGKAGSPGHNDGLGASARFNEPSGIAADADGNLVVADAKNNAIRKITLAGSVTTLVSDIENIGKINQPDTSRMLNGPTRVAVGRTGNVYVVDSNGSAVKMITPTGIVTTVIGGGTEGNSRQITAINSPEWPLRASHMALDLLGNVYVTDAGNNRIIKISPSGTATTLAGSNFADPAARFSRSPLESDGKGDSAGFRKPSGIAVDAEGNLLVLDFATVRKVSPAGVVTTIAGMPGIFNTVDGAGSSARFLEFGSVMIDAIGNIYVAEGNTIRKGVPVSSSPVNVQTVKDSLIVPAGP
jgi:sugar lactone lactonase YvrE